MLGDLLFIVGRGSEPVLTGRPASYRIAKSGIRFLVKGSALFANSRTKTARSLLKSSSVGLPNNPEYNRCPYHLLVLSCVWLNVPSPECVPLFDRQLALAVAGIDPRGIVFCRVDGEFFFEPRPYAASLAAN